MSDKHCGVVVALYDQVTKSSTPTPPRRSLTGPQTSPHGPLSLSLGLTPVPVIDLLTIIEDKMVTQKNKKVLGSLVLQRYGGPGGRLRDGLPVR